MIRAELYYTIFIYTIIILTLVVANSLSHQPFQTIKRGQNNAIAALLLMLILAVWIGMRPDSPVFGDSVYYKHDFYLFSKGHFIESHNGMDWLWTLFTAFCSQTMSAKIYFTIVDLIYFSFTYLACRKAIDNNVFAAVIFLMGSFSFYSYSVNGLRNGMACCILLYAIALCASSRKNVVFGIALSFISANIHKSTLIPIAALFASLYFIRSFKQAYTFWFLSIIVSLVAGGAISSFFAGLGFDDRLSYLNTMDDGKFSKTGFRWDFLIYSMMPIILGYYIVMKRGIRNRTYEVLLNTYTLANAFWIMVIRANYSNRFAYLSWFMYALVLAYPLFRMDIWGNRQGKVASQIMLAHVGFTWFMSFIY